MLNGFSVLYLQTPNCDWEKTERIKWGVRERESTHYLFYQALIFQTIKAGAHVTMLHPYNLGKKINVTFATGILPKGILSWPSTFKSTYCADTSYVSLREPPDPSTTSLMQRGPKIQYFGWLCHSLWITQSRGSSCLIDDSVYATGKGAKFLLTWTQTGKLMAKERLSFGASGNLSLFFYIYYHILSVCDHNKWVNSTAEIKQTT